MNSEVKQIRGRTCYSKRTVFNEQTAVCRERTQHDTEQALIGAADCHSVYHQSARLPTHRILHIHVINTQ